MKESKDIENIQVGSRLKELRAKRRLSIAALSEASQVSTGLISQIEHDKVVPSVVTLWRLSQALETSISYFFEEAEAPAHHVLKKGEQRKLLTDKGHTEYTLYTPSDPQRMLDMCKVCIQPGQIIEEDAMDLVSHEGEECGVVLEGTMIVRIRDQEIVLEEGDSITFRSTEPHKYLNRSDKRCVSMWSMTPTFF